MYFINPSIGCVYVYDVLWFNGVYSQRSRKIALLSEFMDCQRMINLVLFVTFSIVHADLTDVCDLR